MDSKIVEALKGREDSEAICKALEIKDSTKGDRKVLDAIKQCIDLINSGKSIEEAGKEVLGRSSTSKLAKSPQQGIQKAAPQMGEDVKTGIRNLVKKQVDKDVPTVQEAIADTLSHGGKNIAGAAAGFTAEEYDREMGKAFSDPKFLEGLEAMINEGKSQT